MPLGEPNTKEHTESNSHVSSPNRAKIRKYCLKDFIFEKKRNKPSIKKPVPRNEFFYYACHGRLATADLFWGSFFVPNSSRVMRRGSIPFSILDLRAFGMEYKLGGKNTRFESELQLGHSTLSLFPSIDLKNKVNSPQSSQRKV